MNKPFALIIEDKNEIAALFRHVIDMAGYQSEIAFHRQDAIERLSVRQPGLVILDLDLPEVSGNEVLNMIRKEERLRNTKVIVVTSHAHLADSLEMEPDITLFKPISLELFTDFIERFQLKIKYQTTVPIKDEPWDRVTGLYNLSFFKNRLNSSLEKSKEFGQYSFAVLYINLDQNEDVRNQFSIKRWISILREAAKILKNSIGPSDTIARFDQDNFYILLENLNDKHYPKMVASHIFEKLDKNLSAFDSTVRFHIRIGILVCDNEYENTEDIIRDLKNAKTLARASVDGFSYWIDRATIRN